MKSSIARASAAFACILIALTSAGPLVSAPAVSDEDTVAELVSSEIARFSADFPEIEFIWLDGATPLQSLIRLAVALGDHPELMDYQHHPHQVDALNELNLRRIRMMLINSMPSASLYRVDGPVESGKSYVAILTLSPAILVDKPSASTCYMYTIDCSDPLHIATSSRVDNASYLRFVVRHELAHAIKTFLFGGHAITFKEHGGEYNMHISEIWADLYAVMMERRFGNDDTSFIGNLMDARTVNLATNADVQHYTSPAVAAGLDENLSEVSNLRELARIVNALYLDVKPSYEDYVSLSAANHQLPIALRDAWFGDMLHREHGDGYAQLAAEDGVVSRTVRSVEAAMNRVFNSTSSGLADNTPVAPPRQ